MKKILLVLFVCTAHISLAQLSVQNLLCENLVNPVGIDKATPRFTWQLQSDERNIMQTGYQILVKEGDKVIWQTQKISSDASVHVPYKGSALNSGKKYFWQVKVWDNHGNESGWSDAASFLTGLLQTAEWKATWIEPGYIEDSLMRPSPLIRKEFLIEQKVKSAIAFITAHGLYEAHLNGNKIGNAFFTPGWTSYNKRLQYQTYDVTEQIQKGVNAIGVTLGSGWYRGIIGFSNSKNFYGKDIALLMQINIEYEDGTTESIITDKNWKSSTGEIRYAEIYNGEIIDHRMQKINWTLPGFDDASWSRVKQADHTFKTLLATYNEPVKKQETFKAVQLITTPKGEQVIDFGQNLVGWVNMKVKGTSGDKITITHAEVLDKNGNFYTDNLRAAKQQDVFILNGNEEETFEPKFTWHGFRYIKIEGYSATIKPENFTAIALYSDMRLTGNFASSNTLINQLQKNIQWGQKGNFLDVPTDCPQRDERLGWTGDAQVFSRTASFNMHVNNFFVKWLQDLEADQEKGVVPFVIPNVLGGAVSSAGWADAATIIPWNMYLAFGDKQVLAEQYHSMKNYVESIRRNTRHDLWNSGFHFGDWLFYRPDDDNDGRAAVTDKYLIAQCFYAHSTQLLIKTANVLGKNEDAAAYTILLQKIKDAFIKEYVSKNGRLVSGTQTAYVLELNFDMLPEQQRLQAAQRLAENIQNYGNHLTTGFLGTPYLCHVLTRFGYLDLAYTLLLQDTYPSWLYPVKMGATTIWERWDGVKPDGSFQNPGMNSFNHYAYGAIGDWMYRVMVGLDTDEEITGYKKIKIKPHIGGGFTHASASLETYYGTLSNSWKIDSGKIIMDLQIPANTTATVWIPSNTESSILENGKPLQANKDIKVNGYKDNYTQVQVGSGKYSFTSTDSSIIKNNINLEEYTGKYSVAGGGMVEFIEIKNENGKLVAMMFNNSGNMQPDYKSKDKFTTANGTTATFIRNESGKVYKIEMQAMGMTYNGIK